MSTKKLIVRLKDGKNLDDILSFNVMSTGLKVEPLFSIKDEVKNANADLAIMNEPGSQEKFFFENIYEQKSEAEKKLFRTFKLTFNDEAEALKMLAKLSNDGNVDFVAEDGKNHLYFTNDPLIASLYALPKLQCFDAWDLCKGDNITVAVVDTGVDYLHPDLKDNMWEDATGNFGYDFSGDCNDPMDYHGHGTHVAGTVAATGNNGTGIIGIAPKVKIMALKVFPEASDSVISAAIKYAVDNGAKVINNSWGPIYRRERNETLEQVIDYAISKGVVVVFAAGNNNDDIKYYSPNNHPGVISVAATDKADTKADYSNYGSRVTIAAPGSDILSLEWRTGNYNYKSGTSMAAPHVAAICALMLSQDPGRTPDQVRAKLVNSVDPANGSAMPIGAGRVNAFKALK